MLTICVNLHAQTMPSLFTSPVDSSQFFSPRFSLLFEYMQAFDSSTENKIFKNTLVYSTRTSVYLHIAFIVFPFSAITVSRFDNALSHSYLFWATLCSIYGLPFGSSKIACRYIFLLCSKKTMTGAVHSHVCDVKYCITNFPFRRRLFFFSWKTIPTIQSDKKILYNCFFPIIFLFFIKL